MKVIYKIIAKFRTKGYNEINFVKGNEDVRIAICDDEKIFRDQMREIIESYNGNLNSKTVHDFSCGQDLIESHSKNGYNVIFLDIELGDMSGLDVGRKIREKDKLVNIIPATSFPNFMKQSIKLEIIGFIEKPYSENEVHDVLGVALQKYLDEYRTIALKHYDEIHEVKVVDIEYAVIEKRRVKVVAVDGEYYYPGKMDEFERMLANYNFYRSHKSYLVNLFHVKSYKDGCIVTTSGYNVSVSSSKSKECRSALIEYKLKYRV